MSAAKSLELNILKPHKCDQCQKSYNKKHHLASHQKAVHYKIKDHICNLCGRAFAFKDKMKRHISVVHEKLKKYKCDHCILTFARKINLEDHNAVSHNRSDKKYKCSFCDTNAPTSNILYNHIKKAHKINKKKVDCPSCGKKVDEKYLESHHVKYCVKKRSYSCDICLNSFSAKRKLYIHFRKEHKVTEALEDSNGKVNCSKCGKTIKKSYIKKHERLCSGKVKTTDKYTCEVCMKPFSAKRKLRAHMTKDHKAVASKVKKEILTVKCAACEKSIRKSCLERHTKFRCRKIKRTNDYTCEICMKTFTAKLDLRVHIRKDHQADVMTKVKSEVVKVKCPICEK